MATFRATLLAVSPCTLCSATEAVPGSFVSLFSGACFTAHTRTPLPESLSAVLGGRLAPDDTGTMLCRRCVRRIDALDLLRSRRQRLRTELRRAYRSAAQAEADRATTGRRDGARFTCVACHEALSVHENINAFRDKSQFSSTAVSDMLSKLMPLSLEPGRSGGDCVCSACVARLNRLDGLTERAAQQSHLIARQYRAAHGITAAQHQQGPVPDGMPSAEASSDDQLSLLSELDTMLHRLSPDRLSDGTHSPAAGGAAAALGDSRAEQGRPGAPYDPAAMLEVVRDGLGSDPDDPDDSDDPEALEGEVDDPEALEGEVDDPDALVGDSDDPDALGGGSCDPETLGYEPVIFEALDDDGDDPQALGDARCSDGHSAAHGEDADAADEEEEEEEDEEFKMETLTTETVCGAAGSPRPGAPGKVRTIYVQLMAGGAAAEEEDQAADPRTEAGTGAVTSAVTTEVAQTMQVVRLGPGDRLVPQPRPYRKRSDRRPAELAAATEPPAPPVKRGRGRPRKTTTAVKRQHSVQLRQVRYVTARSLTERGAGAAEPAASAAGAGPAERSPVDADTDNEPAGRQRATAETGQETETEPTEADGADTAADWLGAPPDSADVTHRRRLAEAMKRVNSHIAEEKLQSQPAAGRRDAAAPRRPDTSSQMWPISARSRRVNGRYVCEVCQSSYAMLRDILKHEKTHKEAKFPCPMCNKMFTLPKLVRKHQKFHKATTAYQCDECGLRCRSQLVLLEHMHEHTGGEHFSCGVCQRTFASRQCYRTHVRVHTGRRPAPECGVCGRRFSDAAALQRHRLEHAEPRLLCPQPDCERRFDTEKRLTHHLLQHVGGPPWRCAVCDKEFKTKYSLRDHMRGHSGAKPFACELCTARFALRSNLIMHVRYVHQNDRRYGCAVCPKRFKRRRLLAYHMMAHEGDRPLRCPHCPLQMIYPEHLKQHMRTHSGEKPYRCDVCLKSFSRSDNLKAHMFTHSNKKPFECRQCGMGFMRKTLLLQHMEHLGHGEHPHDYVINRTLVTAEAPAPDEEVHTLELVDGEDGHVVMLVKGDGQQEMLVPAGHFVTADGQQVCDADAPLLSSEVQYVTADGQRLDLVIDEADGADGEAAVDLVIEEGAPDGDLRLLRGQQGQLVLQGQDGQEQLVLQGEDGQLVLQGGSAEDRWLLQETKDGQQIVLAENGQQLQLADQQLQPGEQQLQPGDQQLQLVMAELDELR